MNSETNKDSEDASVKNDSLNISDLLNPESEVFRHINALRGEFESALERSISYTEESPRRLIDAMRYSALAPGKRFRPTLALLSAEVCGGSRSDAIPAAVALELVHAYSLIHDDLPAMDNDDLRRGRPTCHIQFDEATAILAGDSLLTRAFEVLATEIPSSAIAARCVRTLAAAAGSNGMTGGQTDDVAWAATLVGCSSAFDVVREVLRADSLLHGRNKSEECGSTSVGLLAFLRKIHRRKTGALIVAALELGALTADATPKQLDALKGYGRELGQAFQISDDILDLSGDEASMGKRVHKDNDAGKLTYPALLGIEKTKSLLSTAVEEAKQILLRAADAFDVDSLAFKALLGLTDFVLERKK